MAQVSKNSQKQEDTQITVDSRGLGLDQLKEDGIRKELYKIERRAQECWKEKWGFLLNFEQLEEEEMSKQGLQRGVFDLKRKQQATSVDQNDRKPAFELLPSKKVPLKSSEMIGWRLFTPKNELNRLVGPIYVSPKWTMNPPLSPDEPDLTQQKIIYLG